MNADRVDGSLSGGVLDGVGSGVIEPLPVSIVSSDTALLVGLVVLVGLVAIAVGGFLVYRRRDAAVDEAVTDSHDQPGGRSTHTTPETQDSHDTLPTHSATDDANSGEPAPGSTPADGLAGPSFDEQIGDRTLERLEPIAPSAVERVRDQRPVTGEQSAATLDQLERELRSGIETALDDGSFDPGVTSKIGGSYDVVNLPRQYRELSVPPAGETVHSAEFESVVREAIDRPQIRDVVRTVTTVHEQCADIEAYVRRRETAYLGAREAVEATLGDIRDLIDRFDGSLADRLTDVVMNGRHDAVAGVVDIERQLDDADRTFHACQFDDATRSLQATQNDAEMLLVVVDFLGGVIGTIDHGSGRVTIPNDVDCDVVADFLPVLEQQYDVDVNLDEDALVIRERESVDVPDTNREPLGAGGRADDTPQPPAANRNTGSSSSYGDSPPDRSAVGSSSSRKTGGSRNTPDRDQFTVEPVADEILFILRELNRRGDGAVVECQTEQLPETVTRPEVLEPLATFCRRQTDVVEAVTLQEDAPPGFLEIEFTGAASASSGLKTIRERFADRHGS